MSKAHTNSRRLPPRILGVVEVNGADPYIERVLTESYVAICSVTFGGTTLLGTPSAITVKYRADVGDPTHDIRIYDRTNGLVVAEVLLDTDSTLHTEDMGALSNLPLGEADFEFQMRQAVGNPVVVGVRKVGITY